MMRSRLFRSVQFCSIVLLALAAARPASAGQLTKLVVFGPVAFSSIP
jgi:hypothetical protein